MNHEDLLKALDNEENSSIMNLNSNKIKLEKQNVLNNLGLDKETINVFMKKLTGYRFVDELQDIKYGCYIRWIKMSDDDETLKLSNGGFITDIKIYDDGCQIQCKNQFQKMMQIKLDNNIVFQKITDQEYVLLSALDYLNN